MDKLVIFFLMGSVDCERVEKLFEIMVNKCVYLGVE